MYMQCKAYVGCPAKICGESQPLIAACGNACFGGCECPYDTWLDKVQNKCVPKGMCSQCKWHNYAYPETDTISSFVLASTESASTENPSWYGWLPFFAWSRFQIWNQALLTAVDWCKLSKYKNSVSIGFRPLLSRNVNNILASNT